MTISFYKPKFCRLINFTRNHSVLVFFTNHTNEHTNILLSLLLDWHHCAYLLTLTFANKTYCVFFKKTFTWRQFLCNKFEPTGIFVIQFVYWFSLVCWNSFFRVYLLFFSFSVLPLMFAQIETSLSKRKTETETEAVDIMCTRNC